MSNTEMMLPVPASDEVGPYTLVGFAKAKPGMADLLEARLISLVEPTRREPGALRYDVNRDRDDPHAFVFYEVWQSVDHLQAHLEKPYVQAFL